MWKVAIFGIVGFILLIGMCLGVRAVGVGPQAPQATATPAPTPTKAGTITNGLKVGEVANWNGYPLARPLWCVLPAKWVMASLPSNKGVVPACLGTLSIGYLGDWSLQDLGCVVNAPIGVTAKPGITLLSNGLPALNVETRCAKTTP